MTSDKKDRYPSHVTRHTSPPAGLYLVPVFAALYLPDEAIAYLTKNGIYAMAIKDDMMDLMNFDDVTTLREN